MKLKMLQNFLKLLEISDVAQNKRKFERLVGYLDDDDLRPWSIIFSKISGYVTTFHENKLMICVRMCYGYIWRKIDHLKGVVLI